MTTDTADKDLLAKLKTLTVTEIVDSLFDTGGTAVTNPYAMVFGTAPIIAAYKQCFVYEIEQRIADARDEGLLTGVKRMGLV